MSNLLEFAKRELDAIGMGENTSDEMNKSMRKHLLFMVEEFSKGGHSGFSASYAIGVLEKLLKFTPLSPLTGEDSEWVDVSKESGYPLYQNNRCFSVFKSDSHGAYDTNGIVFYEFLEDETGRKYKDHFTSKDSRVYITFPYTPQTLYQERKK